ncbi:uncharacterized protein LOC123686127 isoform X2 [Harmonia axyridis]|uniref:uncharacterized protein LOC123686127 isoform X2 n=1 Tax=Harmonia axyridis TaxID=115357 RepID=UPI001E279B49|nr:uncharacterized protein LOC123686127 isoform X2 [Harmonia axyridis]
MNKALNISTRIYGSKCSNKIFPSSSNNDYSTAVVPENCLSTRYGFPGYECLLRLICDTATHPINLTNGVLGDLLHVILTPSSSNETESLEAYLEAERQGIENENCFIYEKNCSYSILDFVTT